VLESVRDLSDRFDVVQSKFENNRVVKRNSLETKFTEGNEIEGLSCKSIESHNNSGVCTLKNHSEV
jgi:hypothetical protein